MSLHKESDQIQQSNLKSDKNNENVSAAVEQKQKQEEVRSSIFTQILDQSALARLNTLRMMKPEKAQMAERYLINLAQSGRLSSKITEDSLISLLEQVSTHATKKAPKITFHRRRNPLDDDDDFL
ncbi:hypothetical protein GJ496_002284 [Pomphorhynchus laevis]|nr:hypothetical protein GJ496_002284 [Pomphorhynchus laevis]